MFLNECLATFVVIFLSLTIGVRAQCPSSLSRCESRVPKYDGLLWSTSKRIISMFSTTSELEDYLNVCRIPLSKKGRSGVKTSLEASTKHFQTLFDALVENDTEVLLEVIGQANQIVPQTIASVEGAVFATLNASTCLPKRHKGCAEQVQMRLRMLYFALVETHVQTRMKLDQLYTEEPSLDIIFKDALQMLSELLMPVERFVKNASHTDDLLRQCGRLDIKDNLRYLPVWIPNHFQWLLPQLRLQSRQTKANALGAVASLYFEVNVVNAICTAVRHANKTDEYRMQVMNEDIRNAELGLILLERAAKALAGGKGFFRRMFGY